MDFNKIPDPNYDSISEVLIKHLQYPQLIDQVKRAQPLIMPKQDTYSFE